MAIFYVRLVKCNDPFNCSFEYHCINQIVTHEEGTLSFNVRPWLNRTLIHPDRTGQAHYHHLPEMEDYEESCKRWSEEEVIKRRNLMIEKIKVSELDHTRAHCYSHLVTA